MSIQIIKTAWEKFQNTPTEDFTGKIMQAISMVELVTSEDFDVVDKDRLYWLRDFTHKDILQPIYELDRYVDETKGKYVNIQYTFKTGTFKQNRIQYYLCVASEEIHSIIYRNFKRFKLEIATNIDEALSGREGGSGWL